MAERASRELFLRAAAPGAARPAAARLEAAQLPAAVQFLSLRVLVQEQEVAVAFPPPWRASVRSNGGRQTHPFFFSKIIPCAGDYKQKVHRLHIRQVKSV